MDDLRRIDLNLLMTLHALLEEEHVTRAAVRLNKSQPAVSHALSQLRAHFDDQLLIRREGKLAMTAKARRLQRPLRDALLQLNGLMSNDGFDPVTAKRQFRLGMSDYAARTILPSLVRLLRVEAPGIDLGIVQGTSRESMIAQLVDGDLDLAMGIFPDTPPDIHVQGLFEDQFICVADSNVVPQGKSLTFEDWLSRPHVMLALRPDAIDEIDLVLARKHVARRNALAMPHWSAAIDLLVGTDLVLTVASRAVSNARPGLTVFSPPLEIPPFTYHCAWHARRDGDFGHGWLRQVIARSVCP